MIKARLKFIKMKKRNTFTIVGALIVVDMSVEQVAVEAIFSLSYHEA